MKDHMNPHLTSKLLMIFFLASCRTNASVLEGCGEGNSCFGSVESYICDCSAPGWRADPSNVKVCVEHQGMCVFKDVYNTMRFFSFIFIDFFQENFAYH